VGGGSGANSAAYVDSPIDALRRQAYEDGSSIIWNFDSQDPDVDPTSDVCLVFVYSYAAEETDRPGLTNEYCDTLITNVAAKCNYTIVIIHNAGVRVVDSWIENDNITAVIFAHLPGQDTGRALVDILYGRANPSGKLPYTVAMSPSDYGSILEPSLMGSTGYSRSLISQRAYSLITAPSMRMISHPDTSSALGCRILPLTIRVCK
jgi:beta-glucosidase